MLFRGFCFENLSSEDCSQSKIETAVSDCMSLVDKASRRLCRKLMSQDSEFQSATKKKIVTQAGRAFNFVSRDTRNPEHCSWGDAVESMCLCVSLC